MTRLDRGWFWPAGITLVVLGTLARLWNLRYAPGWEWDEVGYTYIAQNLYDNGVMSAKTDYLSNPEPYLYHPPFYFHLLAKWFSLAVPGINQARLLAVGGATVTMLLLLSLLRNVIDEGWALIGVGLIATDMWLNFSQRIGWIENTLMPIGILGLLIYQKALEKSRWWLYSLSGLTVGFAAIYKHIGAIFIGALLVHAVLYRKEWRMNLVALATAGVVIVTYIVTVIIAFGPVFVNASITQLLRSVGEQDSAGALNSLSDVMYSLAGQYSIYLSTVALAIAGVLLVLYRLAQLMWRKGRTDGIRSMNILYSWALAAVIFFMLLQLRFPHYAMLAFVPLFCYVVTEVSMIASSRKKTLSVIATSLIILVANAFAFHARYDNATLDDSALRNLQDFATEYIPLGAKVIADESTGTAIPQEYCIMWKGAGCTGATYIVVYTSSTQKIQNNNGQEEMIASSVEIFSTAGYKETITVYQLPFQVP